ncbi:MAG: chemotaxis protein CheW, partial [Selenomonadaceae bacterium]|nr:chemotaxis protein CheW [Selenomonadaceae bacterium]
HVRDTKELFVVVVHAGDSKAGMVVDKLIGQQEIVIKTLGNLFMGLKMFSGATVLGDGKVALILDVATMLN